MVTSRRRTGKAEAQRQRRSDALKLRIAGATYQQIATELGISVGAAYGDVNAELAALDKLKHEQAERLRELEVERCDRLLRALQTGIQAGNPQAIRAANNVAERRAKLLGLDKPQAIELTGAGGQPFTFTLTLGNGNGNGNGNHESTDEGR